MNTSATSEYKGTHNPEYGRGKSDLKSDMKNVRDDLSSLKDDAITLKDDALATGRDAAKEVVRMGKDAVNYAGEHARDLERKASETIQAHPFASVLIAAGVGAIIAHIIAPRR